MFNLKERGSHARYYDDWYRSGKGGIETCRLTPLLAEAKNGGITGASLSLMALSEFLVPALLNKFTLDSLMIFVELNNSQPQYLIPSG